MKKKGVVTVILLLLVSLALTGTIFFSNSSIENSTLQTSEFFVSNHPFIQIFQNSDFEIKYGFPGNGSAINPYIIEDLIIESVGYSGIFMSNVDVHFIIRNCTVLSTNYGMSLQWVEGFNSQIYNNTFWTYLTDGLFFLHASNLTISQNTIKYCSRGIYLSSSTNITMHDNTLVENDVYGVELNSFSHNNSIFGNSFLGNNLGGVSQGNDDGENNTWYNPSTSEGNSWSDDTSGGYYQIDGSALSNDIFPVSVAYTPTGKPDYPLVEEYTRPTDPYSEPNNGGTDLTAGEIFLQILVRGLYPGSVVIIIAVVVVKRIKSNEEFWTNVEILGIPLQPKRPRKKKATIKDVNFLSDVDREKYYEEMRKRGLL